MQILYLDCGMGAAGDMLAAALLDLIEDKQNVLKELNDLALKNVEIIGETKSKCGINGLDFRVIVDGAIEGTDHDHDHHHHHHHESLHTHHVHRSMKDIENIIAGFDLKTKVKDNIINVYKLLAEAESKAHGVEVSEIHFHEVGTLDAIVDITAVCILLDKLSPEKIIASPIRVGSGSVKCAHGILPVPAPATAHILQNVPIYAGEISGELCTPTGAALLKYFVDSYEEMPLIKISAIGYGFGKKDFARLNCVRAISGEMQINSQKSSHPYSIDNVLSSETQVEPQTEMAILLQCNLDDMTAEAMSFAIEVLLTAGALDVFTVPCGMKKSRPAIIFNVLCTQETKAQMVELIFKHTSTIGIREVETKRYLLDRVEKSKDTIFGSVQIKKSKGYGVEKAKVEYEDLIEIALRENLSIAEVMDKINLS